MTYSATPAAHTYLKSDEPIRIKSTSLLHPLSIATMLSPNILTTAIFLAFVVVLYRRAQRNKYGLPLPPGPKKWPLIGSLLSLPTSFEWETYAHWSEIYSLS